MSGFFTFESFQGVLSKFMPKGLKKCYNPAFRHKSKTKTPEDQRQTEIRGIFKL